MADLLLSIDHQIATVTLNRPTQRNAINYEMWCQLTELCLRLENDPQVRVIVFRGTGEEAFSAGGAIGDCVARRSDPWQAKIYNGKVEMALANILRLTKPTIAVIKGYCVGGGTQCPSAWHAAVEGRYRPGGRTPGRQLRRARPPCGARLAHGRRSGSEDGET